MPKQTLKLQSPTLRNVRQNTSLGSFFALDTGLYGYKEQSTEVQA
jgi:hypothetical protein